VNRNTVVASCPVRPGACRRPRLAASALLGLALALTASACFGFGFEDVARRAKALADKPYQPPETNTTPRLRNLEYEQYAQIQYRMDHAVWRDEGLPFNLSFFHEGMHYTSSVQMNIVDGDQVHRIAFNPDDFHYGDLKLDKADLDQLGFAGLKIHFPINDPDNIDDEIMVFQGASYFRVIGRDQIYGLSGRGLAIDTETPSGEEFPDFREFWIEKPAPDADSLTIHALLDSPSATGAYRFVLTPGEDSVVDVKSRVYLRKPVAKLGIAPLTSMFLYGPSQPAGKVNYRPAIHDSNGLLMHGADSGWTWRPLVNPPGVEVNDHAIQSLEGFGLLQRSHDFDDYQDLVDRYDRRPSAWVQPTNDWGPGSVELLELHTPNETYDNIVAFWRPDDVASPGEPMEFDYRMHWTRQEPKLLDPQLAWVDQTRRYPGEVRRDDLVREPDGSIGFVVDFTGGDAAGAPPPQPWIEAGANGELVESRLMPNTAEGGWRLKLRVKRHDETRPLELRARLQGKDGKPLSETWFYRLPSDG